MADQVKIFTNIQTFADTQKSLQEIEKKLNELQDSVNASAESETDDSKGKNGDFKITQNIDKSYRVEVKTEDGWKFGTLGNAPIKYTSKPAEFSQPSSILNVHLPRPDYESGWFNATTGKQYVTGGTDGVVPDSSFAYTAGDVVGIPELGFKLTSEPTYWSLSVAGYNVKSFDDAMTGQILSLNPPAQRYNAASTWYQVGCQVYITSPEHVVLNTSDFAFLTWGAESGGPTVSDDNANFHDSFDTDGSADNVAINFKLWK